jgi:hypothetical protein
MMTTEEESTSPKASIPDNHDDFSLNQNDFHHTEAPTITHGSHTAELEVLRSKIETLSYHLSHNQHLVRAILDLRQWESMRTAERMRHITSDRDHSRAETSSLSSQLKYLEEWIAELYTYVNCSPHNNNDIFQKLEQLIWSLPRLRERVGQDEQAYQSLKQAGGLYGPEAELLLLRQQLHAQSVENDRLKAQMNDRVEAKMDQVFKTTLQTAIEVERRKDAFVINDLRREKQRLMLALSRLSGENEHV